MNLNNLTPADLGAMGAALDDARIANLNDEDTIAMIVSAMRANFIAKRPETRTKLARAFLEENR